MCGRGVAHLVQRCPVSHPTDTAQHAGSDLQVGTKPCITYLVFYYENHTISICHDVDIYLDCLNHDSLLFFSITVDNTYDNIDNVVEVHNQHEDDYEPEETYIIPNCPPVSGEISKQSTTVTRSNQQGNQTSNQYRDRTGENVKNV